MPTPIGRVKGGRSEPVDDGRDAVRAVIEPDPAPFGPTALDGLGLGVEGLDAIDGSPVLDIEPVMSGLLPRGEIREPDRAIEIMARQWSP